MNKVLTIAKRELRSYFDSLVAYVVVGGSMLGLGVWFFLMQQVDEVCAKRISVFHENTERSLNEARAGESKHRSEEEEERK